MKRFSLVRMVSSAALCGFVACTLHAQVIVNGGFESGLAGWTSADQLGSDGSFMIQSGTMSPVNGFAVPAPPQGTWAAMTDAQGPGSHVLFQDFVVPTSSVINLEFSLFIGNGNGAPDFFTPPTLDFATTALNQRVRVDLMTTTSDPFSLLGPDIVLNVFETMPGSPLVMGYNPFQVDVTAALLPYQGMTLRLRFAEVDNVAPMNLGVDAVAVTTGRTNVPDTLSLGALASTLLALFALRRRAKS